MGKSKTHKKDALKLRELMFSQLDLIYTACEGSANAYKTDTIPLSVLKVFIDKFKASFDEGMNEEFKKK